MLPFPGISRSASATAPFKAVSRAAPARTMGGSRMDVFVCQQDADLLHCLRCRYPSSAPGCTSRDDGHAPLHSIAPQPRDVANTMHSALVGLTLPGVLERHSSESIPLRVWPGVLTKKLKRSCSPRVQPAEFGGIGKLPIPLPCSLGRKASPACRSTACFSAHLHSSSGDITQRGCALRPTPRTEAASHHRFRQGNLQGSSSTTWPRCTLPQSMCISRKTSG